MTPQERQNGKTGGPRVDFSISQACFNVRIDQFQVSQDKLRADFKASHGRSGAAQLRVLQFPNFEVSRWIRDSLESRIQGGVFGIDPLILYP